MASKTIYQKIKETINLQLKQGKLNPGDKLPSYSQLCAKFNVSYASVQYAFKEFEKEGLVERVQGVGTFLKGSDPLEIEIYLNTSTFPAEQLEPLLAQFTKDANLHINVKVKNILQAYNIKSLNKNRRVVIVQDAAYPNFSIGSSLDLSAFSDFKFVTGQLNRCNEGGSNLGLPFYRLSFQVAYNPVIVKKLGFENKINGSDWDWWNDYIVRCTEENVIPAAKDWDMRVLWNFERLRMFLLPMLINERKSSDNLLHLPMFKTTSGKMLLNIMKSHYTCSRNAEDDVGFVRGNVGVNLSQGSWIAAHYMAKFNLDDESIKIIPYKLGTKKICSMTEQFLKPFVCADIKPDEKKRVWELLKIFVSKEFQLKLCGMSGAVSVRKDVSPEEHSWNTREDFNAFFPAENDIVINNNIFNDKVMAVLSALYEQYEFFGANEEQILESMDIKVESMLKPM